MKLARFPQYLVEQESKHIDTIYENSLHHELSLLKEPSICDVVRNKIISQLEKDKNITINKLNSLLTPEFSGENLYKQFLSEYKRVLQHDFKEFNIHYDESHAKNAMKSTFAKVLKPFHKN